MIGEQRQVLADILWARAKSIINDLKKHGQDSRVEEGSDAVMDEEKNYKALSDDQMKILSK